MPADYYIEENEEEGTSSATPFQSSSEMPAIEIDKRPGAIQTNNKRLLKIVLVATIVVIAFGFLWLSIPAQQPLAVVATPTRPPQQTPTAQTPKTSPSGTWTPPQLPAGLTTEDGIEALQTASIFTDREEGIDFHAIGTRTQHGGTMIAATFLLSPGGQFRFFHNDRRVINNVLFDKVANEQLEQSAVNVVPHLTTVTVQGKDQFTWVDVSFELFQSNHQGEGLQPDMHHMSVLLVRVAGESSWLVSSYNLDLQNNDPLEIVSPA